MNEIVGKDKHLPSKGKQINKMALLLKSSSSEAAGSDTDSGFVDRTNYISTEKKNSII